MIGVHFEDNHVATGFGNHLARPILRDEWREDMSYEEGVKLLEKCMLVLLYRDRSAINKLQVWFFCVQVSLVNFNVLMGSDCLLHFCFDMSVTPHMSGMPV